MKTTISERPNIRMNFEATVPGNLYEIWHGTKYYGVVLISEYITPNSGEGSRKVGVWLSDDTFTQRTGRTTVLGQTHDNLLDARYEYTPFYGQLILENEA